MRKYVQVFFFVFSCYLFNTSNCFSQKYWNEWINFSQKYYKIPVSQNGIYRLDSLTLSKAGIPLTLIDPRNIQLYFRGKEQYIFIKGESDGVFNPTDYIEFYGQKNDGSLDSILYKGNLYNRPARQPNPYYSLFSDTAAYFLTWNNSFFNKRMLLSTDTAFSTAPIPTNYFMKEEIVEGHASYYYGKTTSTNITFPEYDAVEGWAGLNFYQGTSNTTNFNTVNVYSSGRDIQVKLAVMGLSDDLNSGQDHNLKFFYKNNSGGYTLLDNPIFDGYQLIDSTYFIPASTIGTFTDIVVTAQNGNFSTSRNAVSYVSLKYPHNLDLENKSYYELYVPGNQSQQKSNFSFININDMGFQSYIYDFENHLKIPIVKSGSTYKALVPNSISASENFCIVKSENQYLNVQSIIPVQGTGMFTNYSQLAVDSAFIIITNKTLRGIPGADEYATYRASIDGGGHNVIVANIDELYDQFSFGIPKHPFSIRHFVNYCLDTFPSLPQNLFLIGKSIQTNAMRNTLVDLTGKNTLQCLVPSIGFPTSDNMLVSALNKNVLAPAVPIGRLAAKNVTDISIYLKKMIEYEHPLLAPDEWMKQAIFMGGGGDANQQAQFCNYLNDYENIIEDTCFGGKGYRFCKNSSSTTQVSYTDSIRNRINNGVSLITFFGHTAATLFDFNLLPPNEYENSNGKYPFFIANGCVAGDIHQPVQNGTSSSEIYTLSNKGMIGFLASSGPGTANEMDQLTRHLYKGIGKYLYGKSIGRCIQAAIDSIDGNATNQYIVATCLEMTLHGDPSIVIHSNKLPDYAVKNSSLYFSPPYISTDLDSFNVHVIVTNIGKATQDSVTVKLKRTFMDGTSSWHSKIFPKLYYKDTLVFTLPLEPSRGAGQNKFEVRVDSANVVPELEDAINNNLISPNEIQLFIYSGDIIPVYPYKYAIVSGDTTMLKAYTANPFASTGRYVFEVDTTDLFNSPLKRMQYVRQMGAVVKASFNGWGPTPLILTDSTVYFWHVRRDTSDTINFRWRESSFQYIPNKRGWSQSHFFQFLKGDKFNNIDTNKVSRYFDLVNKNNAITVKTLNAHVWGAGYFSHVYFELNTLEQYLWSSIGAITPHVIISVLDPITGDVWHNNGKGPYGSYVTGHPSGVGDEGFEFYTSTPLQQENLRRFLQDTIPCGSKVIIFTSGDHNLGSIIGGNSPTINTGLVKAFQSIGGIQFTNIKDNNPYILVGRKCGDAIEKIGVQDSSVIFLYDTCTVKRESGFIYSEVIGPASKWKSMHWKYVSPEEISNPALAAQDTMKITIIGIKSTGGVDTLYKNVSKDSLDIYNLDQHINAKTYPYLKLQAWVKDKKLRTPPQLKYWRLYYDGMPDAALNPAKHFSFYKSSVQQGDSIKMSVAIENIGDYNMDSLMVNFWAYDANRNLIRLPSIKLDSLLIGKAQNSEVKFSTENLPGGMSSLWIEANPFNSTHQLEQYHFNNIGALPFNVKFDNVNPLLDVTFDGVHIMNGDFVSAKPLVTIGLKDENTFFALNDTSDFEVYLKAPLKTSFERIYFGSKMIFYPASLPNNSCRINYTPVLSDGKYELKVQAKDRTGNNSGNTEYKITFEIVNKPTVTNVLNYPNPFSTSTKFVFTLTGSEVPDYFKIQILTITGKIVKDLNKDELGPLHIGRNITEYAWDGKDDFGDQLANGLYLYRVVTQLGGKSLEHRESSSDAYFTQGYGKMYLIH
jgi:hypothetical protein